MELVVEVDDAFGELYFHIAVRDFGGAVLGVEPAGHGLVSLAHLTFEFLYEVLSGGLGEVEDCAGQGFGDGVGGGGG